MLTSISALDNLDLVFFLDLAKTSFIDLTFSALLDLALGDLTMSYVLREFFQKEKNLQSVFVCCMLNKLELNVATSSQARPFIEEKKSGHTLQRNFVLFSKIVVVFCHMFCEHMLLSCQLASPSTRLRKRMKYVHIIIVVE